MQTIRDILETNTLFSALNTAFITEQYFTEHIVLEKAFLAKYGDLAASDLLMEFNHQPTGLAKYIYLLKKDSWKHLAALTEFDYNPIWNYDGTTTITESWEDYKESASGSKEQTVDGTSTSEQLVDGRTDSKVYGFDSSTGVNDNSSTFNGGKSELKTNAGKTEDESERTIEGKHITEEVKGGNQGTTMTQQMMEAEKNFWNNYGFYDIVFKDLKNILSSPMWV